MLDNIKSSFILKKVFNHIPNNIFLKLIIHNKNLQKKLNIPIDKYINYSNQIEIEIIPDIDIINKDETSNIYKLINIKNDEDKKYFHIYFDEGKKEVNRNCLNKNDNVSKIKILIDKEIKSIAELFYQCIIIKEIKIIKFNRTDFIDYSKLFNFCKNLINLDISKLKTNKVIDMSHMFEECSSLKYIDLSNFETNNVTNMNFMFHNCTSLEKLNTNNFKTYNVKEMSSMFSGCRSLKNLDLSNFRTDNVTNMDFMFFHCSSLIKLNISNFITNKVTNMSNMFNYCSLIINLDLSNFKTNKVKDMFCMFCHCSSLKELYITEFELSALTDVECMFGYCSTKLKYKMKNKFKNINEKAYADNVEYCDNNLNHNYFDYTYANCDYY